MAVRRRLLRINDLLRDEISDLIARQVRDPRLSAVVTITDVETAPDLSHARVHVSVYGSENEKAAVLIGLRHATGFLRHELAERIKLRQIPDLSFELDDSIERGVRVVSLIQNVAAAPDRERDPQADKEEA